MNKWDLRLDYHLSDHDSLFGVYSHSVGLPWFDPLGTPPVDPYTRNHAHSRTAQWLNPAAFVSPAPGQWGDSPRDGYFGPGYWNYDISVLKNFYIREGQTLLFRVDFLDAFNHTNWDGGGTSIGGTSATVVGNVRETQYGGAAVTNFGDVTTGEGSRVIQASLRYTF